MRAVPRWNALSEQAHKDLSPKNINEAWFDQQPDKIRLTVLNLYVKLKGMDLWQFVGGRASVSEGCLEFWATDVKALTRELTNRWNFRSPGQSSKKEWDSAEKRATASLHFKNFYNPKRPSDWPENKVQAHIDQAGNWLGDPTLWWAGQPVTGIRHLAAYDSYKDVLGTREILLQQGWDPKPLIGVGTWYCGARDCPGHSEPGHRCRTGVWHCGRRQPPCPGHNSPDHLCNGGQAWDCWARNCPTHSRPEHECSPGVWFCGRIAPPCPGHSKRDHRCQAAAALLPTHCPV
jgi:hypothetical protein